jgi:hypothetical protein
MRVKVLIALAIASVLLLCSTGAAFAAVSPCSISGIPTAADLTNAANSQINAFGFPDLTAASNSIASQAALDQNCGNCGAKLESPICGVCGDIPDCNVKETTTIFGGPDVNLACPIVNTYAVPVNLQSPMINPTFPTICLAPEVCLGLPQVNLGLNCFDITCCPLEKPIDP